MSATPQVRISDAASFSALRNASAPSRRMCSDGGDSSATGIPTYQLLGVAPWAPLRVRCAGATGAGGTDRELCSRVALGVGGVRCRLARAEIGVERARRDQGAPSRGGELARGRR